MALDDLVLLALPYGADYKWVKREQVQTEIQDGWSVAPNTDPMWSSNPGDDGRPTGNAPAGTTGR